jgi:hypothetical protein
MSLYISTKDGYSCKVVNPFDGNYSAHQYDEFELSNPELPLTEHVEVGEVFEGENVIWDKVMGYILTATKNIGNNKDQLEYRIKPSIHPTQTVGEGEKPLSAEDWLTKNCNPNDWDKLEEGLSDFINTTDVCRYMERYSVYRNSLLPSPPKI